MLTVSLRERIVLSTALIILSSAVNADRTPGACNGCEKLKSCRFDKYLYKPTIAYEEYRSELVESRTGINLTSSEAVELGNTIKPLLLKGHSPYQIIAAHPELGISEKTLYNYIEQGVFECWHC